MPRIFEEEQEIQIGWIRESKRVGNEIIKLIGG